MEGFEFLGLIGVWINIVWIEMVYIDEKEFCFSSQYCNGVNVFYVDGYVMFVVSSIVDVVWFGMGICLGQELIEVN